MRNAKSVGLSLVGAATALLFSSPGALASTEVFRSSANNTFATAVSNPPGGPSQEVIAVRSEGPGGPTTTVSFYASSAESVGEPVGLG